MSYTIDDFTGETVNTVGSPLDDRQGAFLRFMAGIRPWIIKAGSALDIEELMAYWGLPTSREGWVNMGRNEIELALAIADFYGTFAHVAFDKFPVGSMLTPGENQEVNVIGPWLLLHPAYNEDKIPFQVAISTGDYPAEAIVNYVTGGTSLVSALNGLPNPATSNPNIEHGENRMIIRREQFDLAYTGLNGDSVLDPEYRNGIKPEYTLTLQCQAYEVTVSTSNAIPPLVGDLYLSGTLEGKILRVTDNGADSYTLVLHRDVQSPTDGAAAYGTSGGSLGTVTAAVALTDIFGSPLPVRAYNPNAAEFSAFGTQYPNFGDTTSPIANLLTPDIENLCVALMGGITDNALGNAEAKKQGGGRADARAWAAYGLRMLTAILEHIRRGHFTELTGVFDFADFSGENIKTLLSARGLPADESQAFGSVAKGTNSFDSGSGTAPQIGDVVFGCEGGEGVITTFTTANGGTSGTIGIKLTQGRFIDDDILTVASTNWTATLRGHLLTSPGAPATLGTSRRDNDA